jgi:hypothetical protein
LANTGTVIGIIVVAVLAIIFLPKIMQGVKGFSFSNTLTTTGNGAHASANGNSRIVQKNSGSGGSNIDIDVEGNACACVNGICEGNCSDMEKIDLENFDPLSWVEEHT